MERYRNRQHAGLVLAEHLQDYANRADTIILALPRGGVPVAYEVSKRLNLPLDVFIVRKLGVPGHVELAMGAISVGDTCVFNNDIIEDLQIPQNEINATIEREKEELERREKTYRGDRPFPNLKNKTVILIDDGIATGATIRAAIQSLKQMQIKSLVVAVPVAARDTIEALSHLVDEIICPMQPIYFQAVGIWYEQFTQTEDEEVHLLLNRVKHV